MHDLHSDTDKVAYVHSFFKYSIFLFSVFRV